MKIIKDSPIPLYKQILNAIRARIANSEWQAGVRLPTEAELGDELKVSRVTIRQALSEAVEEGLVVRIPGKGTFVSGLPNAPRAQGFIGYIVPHLSSSFNVQILLGVESVLKAKGYHLIFCNSEGSLSEENRLLKSLATEDMAGYVIQPVYAENHDRALLRLVASQKPVVMIDRDVPDIHADWVASNHFEGGRAVVQCLIDQGYTDIVYLARQPLQLSSIAERLRGYHAAMVEAGLNPLPPFTVGGPTELGYIEGQGHLTAEENALIDIIASFLRRPDRPQAIVAMNDVMGLLVLEAAHRCGLRIPDDIAVVGFDNLDFAANRNLTTVAQQPFQIGIEVARLLLERIEGERAAVKQIHLPTQLIVRGSSMNPLRAPPAG